MARAMSIVIDDRRRRWFIITAAILTLAFTLSLTCRAAHPSIGHKRCALASASVSAFAASDSRDGSSEDSDTEYA